MSECIKCMIAEDYPTLNDIFKNLVNYEHDMEVIGSFLSGREIYEAIVVGQDVPDVILMDVEMETRLAGITYSKKILDAYSSIRIIMLTCYEDEDVIIDAYETGVIDYVLKNNSSSIILEAIRAAYHDKSPIRPYAATAIRKKLLGLSTYRQDLMNITSIMTTLTSSELEVLKLLIQGRKQKEIAKDRTVVLSTVKYHVSSILRKFHCKRTQEVVQIVKELGIDTL